MAGTCEYGDEPSGSKNWGGISCLAADPVCFSRRTLLHGISKYVVLCYVGIARLKDLDYLWEIIFVFIPQERVHCLNVGPIRLHLYTNFESNLKKLLIIRKIVT